MVSVEEVSERIKVMINVEDSLQDQALKILITNVKKHLLSKLRLADENIEEVPENLDYIIDEISIRRYNRIGAEGMKSESVEGHKIDFYELEKDFTPYEDVINSYRDTKTKRNRGSVMFF